MQTRSQTAAQRQVSRLLPGLSNSRPLCGYVSPLTTDSPARDGTIRYHHSGVDDKEEDTAPDGHVPSQDLPRLERDTKALRSFDTSTEDSQRSARRSMKRNQDGVTIASAASPACGSDNTQDHRSVPRSHSNDGMSTPLKCEVRHKSIQTKVNPGGSEVAARAGVVSAVRFHHVVRYLAPFSL